MAGGRRAYPFVYNVGEGYLSLGVIGRDNGGE